MSETELTVSKDRLPPWRRDNVDLLRRLLVVGYSLAGLTVLIAVGMQGPDHGNVGLLVIGVMEACVAVTLAVGRKLPAAVIKFFGFEGGVLFVGLAIVFARPLGPTPLYYLWPAFNCAYFGSRRDAWLTSVLMCVSFAVALRFANDVQVPAITYIAVVSIFLVVLFAIQRMAERTDELVKELAHAAATDSLTGLLDRRAFGQAFEREVERARTSGLDLSLVFFDLDHFKQVNDGYGHAAGDEALRAFAQILEAECSVADLFARMGGEEFATVLFDADEKVARRFAEQTAAALAGWSERHPPLLTTSVGIAVLSDEIATPSQLLIAADRALYAAKAAGRNRVLASGQRTARVLVAA